MGPVALVAQRDARSVRASLVPLATHQPHPTPDFLITAHDATVPNHLDLWGQGWYPLPPESHPHALPFPDFLRAVRLAREFIDMPADQVSERILVAPLHRFSKEMPSDQVGATRKDLRCALAAIEPFVRGLDPLAVSWADDSGTYVPKHREIGYVDTDPRFEGGGALHAVLREFPELGLTAAKLRRHDPASFWEATSGSVETLLETLRLHLSDVMGRPPGIALLSIKAARAVATLSDEDRHHFRCRFAAGLAYGNDSAVDAARLLAGLPSSWIPRDGRSWVSLAECSFAVRWCIENAAEGHAADFVHAKGDWKTLAVRLANAHGSRDNGVTLSDAVMATHDVVRAMTDQLIVPVLARWSGRPESAHTTTCLASSMLFSGRSICRVLELSRRWHVRSPAMRSALVEAEATMRWIACLPHQDFTDVTIRVLTSARELEDEGKDGPDGNGIGGLAHCVGQHAGACLAGEARVVSLRERDGARSSTAEVSWVLGRARIIEHSAYRNRRPMDRDRHALATYIAMLNDGRLQAEDDELPQVDGKDSVSLRCGYDWTRDGACERALTVWRPFLPRSLRSTTVDELGDAAARHRNVQKWSWTRNGFDLSRSPLVDAGDLDRMSVERPPTIHLVLRSDEDGGCHPYLASSA